MVQKSANCFVLGTKRTETRSPERRQYGLSIDTQGINGWTTGDDRQSRLIKFVQASSLLWERVVRCQIELRHRHSDRSAERCVGPFFVQILWRHLSTLAARAAQTGQAYSSTDRTMLQYTCTSCMIVRPLFLSVRSAY